MHTQIKEKIYVHGTAIFLFCIFCLRYWLNAQGKPFWTDEADGIFNVTTQSWKDILYSGLNGQSSRSPLYYIFDKAWLEFWNYHPQQYWDLRVFFRILPALYWVIACISVYYYSFSFIKRKLAYIPFWYVYVLALGITFFYFHHSFLHIYAIETRATSLWIAFSTIHLLFFLESIDRDEISKCTWIFYSFFSFLLVLTTYASIMQVLLALFLFAARQWKKQRLFHIKQTILPVTTVAVPSLFGTFWYFTQLATLNYGRPTLEIYFSSVMEIFLKSFHHHGIQPAFLTLPLFLIIIPFIYRKNTIIAYSALNGFALILISFVQFKLSQWKGYIYAPRYASFLVPTFSWFYFMGLYSLLNLLISQISKKFFLPKNSVIYILLLLSFIEISNGLVKAEKEISHNLTLAQTRSLYKLTPRISECSGLVPPAPADLEKMNDYCRGISSGI